MPRVFQPVPNVVEVSIQGTFDGQLVENKFYAEAASAVTSAMVDELATIAANWVGSHFLAAVPASYVHSRCVARDLTTEASFESINASQAGNAGTASGAVPLPGNATIAVHRSTPFSGVKQKSRIYHIGLADGGLASPDKISTGTATALINLYEALRTAILAGTSTSWKYGYVQRIFNKVRLTNGNFIEVFGHALTDLFVDSQRRRLMGRGR